MAFLHAIQHPCIPNVLFMFPCLPDAIFALALAPVHYSTAQYSTAQHSTAPYRIVPYRTVVVKENSGFLSSVRIYDDMAELGGARHIGTELRFGPSL